MDITITVRETDVDTLTEIATEQWRQPEQQASAFLEQALRAYRAKVDPAIRRTRSRRIANAA